MKNDIMFEILKKAAEKGLFDGVDVTEEFRSIIRKDKVDQGLPSNWRDTPKMIFDGLKKLDYIHYFAVINKSEDETDIPDNWLELISVNLSMRPAGLLFFYEREKVIAAKNSIVFTKIGLGLTFLFSIITLGFSYFNYDITKQNAISKAEMQPLQKQIVSQKLLLSKKQSEVDSLTGLTVRLLAKQSAKKH